MLNFSAGTVKGLFFVRLAYFLFLLGVVALCVRLRLERILAPITGGIAFILFLYGIVQKFVIFPLILRQYAAGPSFFSRALLARAASGRVFAIFPLPTLYAAICGLLLIFIVHYFYHSRGGIRLFWVLLFLLGAFNLVLTQSFGGILFFTVGIVIFLFVSRIFKIKSLAPLLMVLALALFAVTALRFSEARELSPLRLRFANWAQAGRMIAAAPVLGVGLGNYETAVPPFVHAGEPESIFAHNFFLQMAAETGLPLFILLVVLALPWLKANLPHFLMPEKAPFVSACVLLLFYNLFDVGNYFFAAGIVFAVLLSQLAAPAGPARPLHFIALALPAALLLLHAAAAGRQQEGDLLLSRGEAGRARDYYRSALKLEPFSYRSWLGLAAIAWERGDREAANQALQKVLAIHPGQPFANYLHSVSSWRRGAWWTALAGAARAAAGSRNNQKYQRWHERLQGALAR